MRTRHWRSDLESRVVVVDQNARETRFERMVVRAWSACAALWVVLVIALVAHELVWTCAGSRGCR